MNDKNITDEFVSTLSHEIRTPLTSIKGFAETLYDNYDALNDEQKKKFLIIIQEQSKRLINLVENVLNVAKLNSGEDKCVLKEVNLLKSVNSAVEVLKISYPNKIFEINCAKNLPSTLSDFDKLQQILVNILENACKYSSNSSPVVVNLLNKNDKNVIEIKDFGEGISKENSAKIFDKFYRIGTSLTNKAQGSGLGLYIVKTLCDKLGLKIELESDTGENHFTKFSIILPVFEIENITKNISGKQNV